MIRVYWRQKCVFLVISVNCIDNLSDPGVMQVNCIDNSFLWTVCTFCGILDGVCGRNADASFWLFMDTLFVLWFYGQFVVFVVFTAFLDKCVFVTSFADC